MKHKLPDLNFKYNALEPYFDAATMELHHSKHHAAYVNNLNAALDKKPELFELRLEELIKYLDKVPEDIYWVVRNNGGGHLNHGFFWESLAANGKDTSFDAKPRKVVKEIESTFGSFDSFKETFKNAALGRFGSGWAWLVANENGNLKVVSTPNQDNPLSDNLVPLVGLDVWEHAYYLKYNNRRADYIDAFWKILSWEVVEARYSAVLDAKENKRALV